MAGSFKHVTTNAGKLVDYDTFIQLIENSGDAYEAIEEMYGMIWWLATELHYVVNTDPAVLVEQARDLREVGFDQSPGVEK